MRSERSGGWVEWAFGALAALVPGGGVGVLWVLAAGFSAGPVLLGAGLVLAAGGALACLSRARAARRRRAVLDAYARRQIARARPRRSRAADSSGLHSVG